MHTAAVSFGTTANDGNLVANRSYTHNIPGYLIDDDWVTATGVLNITAASTAVYVCTNVDNVSAFTKVQCYFRYFAI